MRSTALWGSRLSGNGELIAKPPSTRFRQSLMGVSWLGQASGCVSAQGQMLALLSNSLLFALEMPLSVEVFASFPL